MKSPRRTRHKSVGSRLVAVISDIHFDLHHVPTWHAFRQWHAEVRPWKTVVLGDFVDLGMMSHYAQEKGAKLHAIPQIKAFVKEANELRKECGDLVVVEGNHDERWSKFVGNLNAAALEGALGMSLREQCLLQGLDKRVEWFRETEKLYGLKVGQFWLRHGHNQGGRFGGGKHLAANRIMKNLGESEIIGHHHRVQMFCQTARGKTAVALVNGNMTVAHAYAKDADWQKGFSILELQGPKFDRATPHPVLIENGRFAWGGHTYDGNRR